VESLARGEEAKTYPLFEPRARTLSINPAAVDVGLHDGRTRDQPPPGFLMAPVFEKVVLWRSLEDLQVHHKIKTQPTRK
jgi:hypothetical protein